jgi:hypothetical protein
MVGAARVVGQTVSTKQYRLAAVTRSPEGDFRSRVKLSAASDTVSHSVRHVCQQPGQCRSCVGRNSEYLGAHQLQCHAYRHGYATVCEICRGCAAAAAVVQSPTVSHAYASRIQYMESMTNHTDVRPAVGGPINMVSRTSQPACRAKNQEL